MLKNSLSSNTIKNIFSLGISQFIFLMIPIIMIPLIIRRVGLEGFGYFSLCQGLAAFIFLIIESGNDIFFTSRLANNKKQLSPEESQSITAAYIVKIISSILLLVITIIILGTWREHFNTFESLILSSVLLGITQGFSLSWLLHSRKIFFIPSFFDVISKFTGLAACFFLVTKFDDLYSIFLAQAILNSIWIVLIFFFAIKNYKLTLYTRRNKLINYLHEIIPGFYLKIISFITSQSGIYIASLVLNPYLLGVYAVSDRVSRVVRIVVSVINKVFYPRISILAKVEMNSASGLLKTNLLLNLIISISFILLFIALPERIYLSFIGESDPSIYKHTLQFICIIPFVAINSIVGFQWLYNLNYDRITVRSTSIGAVAFIILGLLLGSTFSITGVIMSFLLTEIIMLIAYLYFFRSDRLIPRII